MGEELKFKIKIFKYFDVDNEKEIVEHYVKKKTFFGWWYLTTDFGDEWFAVFCFTFILDFVLLLCGGLILKSWDIDLFNLTFFLSGIIFLRVFWYLMTFKMFKKDFGSRENALKHIKDLIRKSNLETYHTTEDIKITYKEGNLEVEK